MHAFSFELGDSSSTGLEVRMQLQHRGEGLRGRERQVARGQAGEAQWPSQPGILLLDVWHLC